MGLRGEEPLADPLVAIGRVNLNTRKCCIDVKLKTYEARLYNNWVRLLLDSGEPNVTGFSDAWADTRYVEVRADSIEQAARLLARDYPSEAGFVVIGIEELPEPDKPRLKAVT
ncbi:hypothetical protein [Stappia sp. P2PMeth1]|uniref:hypothetical protein n=1 Tax=Stappia sp. P2PMeth1 TaxID=2003586 RepID=UPI001646F170|nr:hypothetical protein [Stappia sp. P2PMeth1]